MPVGLTVTVLGNETVALELAAIGASVYPRSVAVVTHWGLALATQVKANASGRPGPRVQTGDYRRSIVSEVRQSPDAIMAIVGTNKPQGRRLELGFIGVDSLGRHFNQPPYPHFAPAVAQIAPMFTAAVANIV